MKTDVLDARALNRATLHRQGLLERGGGVVDTIEHLVGIQAQNPHDPYYALWARIAAFDPTELSRLLVERRAVRGSLMRATLHLSTARDYLRMRPVLHSVLARVFGSTYFAKDTAGIDRKTLLALARELLEETPRTRAELAALLEERLPGSPGASLAQMVTYLLPVVQVPPRGVFGSSGQARWALAEEWIGRELETDTSPDGLILRYLGAFGPASVADMRVWSGLAGLREVVDRLHPRLRVWRGEEGPELFDLADATHPDPDTPAPPRLLPEYDNVLLGHADRSRFFTGPTPPGWVGNLLVDGFYAGSWKLARERGSVRVELEPQVKLSRSQLEETEAEANRLVRVVAAQSQESSVLVNPSD